MSLLEKQRMLEEAAIKGERQLLLLAVWQISLELTRPERLQHELG